LNYDGIIDKIPLEFQEEIKSVNQEILKKFFGFLYKTIENITKPLVDEIKINQTFSYEELITKINFIRSKFEKRDINNHNKSINLKLFSYLKKFYKEEIHFNEGKSFIISNKNNEEVIKYRIKIESFIKSFSTLYDIINSNLFSFYLEEAFEYDFSILNKTIQMNMEDIFNRENMLSRDIPIAKILSFLMKISENILSLNKTIYLLNSFNKRDFNEEINYFFKLIAE
jgi:hypothetical protein